MASLKKTWRRLVLRGARYAGNYRRLDASYVIRDPWSMRSAPEQFRFKETNRLLLETFGRVTSMLEIGCGEGHQSTYLRQVCARLTGLDVSGRAVTRARGRCPQAEFVVGDIFAPQVTLSAPYDLVVACEVLYYMADVPAALGQIRSLGRNCLVTYLTAETETLDRHAARALPGARFALLQFGGYQWRTVFWSAVVNRTVLLAAVAVPVV
jgi:SAM-dependent methyltransferase